MRPETQYADSHGLSIAYQVMGDGDIDVIVAPGMISHVELHHDFPGYTHFLRRMSEFARVITFDKRGQGLSDALYGTPTLEERMDDLLSVMDAAGSDRAAIFGFSEGGPLAFLTAATHPDRVSRIATFGAYAKACGSDTYPHMLTAEERRHNLTHWLDDWGRGGGNALSILCPELADDPVMRRLYSRIERYSSTPSAMRRYFEVNFGIDVTDILSAVRVPCLIMHREDDLQVPPSAGHHLVGTLPDARYVDCGSGGHLYWVGDVETALSELRNFLAGGGQGTGSSDRVLATLLFTDIVGSTAMLGRLGDAVWKDIVDRHDQICAETVALNRGRLIKHTGDGILATFDGPGRGVDCAQHLVERLSSLGISIRAGLHTGEIDLRGDDVAGANVHIAARIMDLAEANQVLVSRTVADLMTGTRSVTFAPAGTHTLKGVDKPVEIVAAGR